MLKVLKFDDVFIVKKTMQPINNQNNSNLMIQQVLCQMLDPKNTDQMTEDERRNHIEYTIEASLELYAKANKE